VDEQTRCSRLQSLSLVMNTGARRYSPPFQTPMRSAFYAFFPMAMRRWNISHCDGFRRRVFKAPRSVQNQVGTPESWAACLTFNPTAALLDSTLQIVGMATCLSVRPNKVGAKRVPRRRRPYFSPLGACRGPTRRCSCQVRADRVLPFGELGATIGAGTPAGAGARRLRCGVRGLAADRQVRWATAKRCGSR
jgi:hypothetical protein